MRFLSVLFLLCSFASAQRSEDYKNNCNTWQGIVQNPNTISANFCQNEILQYTHKICRCTDSKNDFVVWTPPTAAPTDAPTTVEFRIDNGGPCEKETSSGPTAGPYSDPSTLPSSGPTPLPSSGPTSGPSSDPSTLPSFAPSSSPSSGPTLAPSSYPSDLPSAGPHSVPSFSPSDGPSSNVGNIQLAGIMGSMLVALFMI